MQKTQKRKPQLAFTLAEILITLGIIGVIAAVTIPSLLNNTNDSEYAQALKKSYAELQQAYTLVKNDNNGTLKNVCDEATTPGCLRDELVKYLLIKKTCAGTNSTGTNCWPNTYTWLNSSSPYTMNGYYDVVLNDGVIFNINYDNTCPWGFTLGGNYCGWSKIDINGDRKPNKFGKDTFIFYILPNKGLVPYGLPGDNISGDPNYLCDPVLGKGHACTYQYLYQK